MHTFLLREPNNYIYSISHREGRVVKDLFILTPFSYREDLLQSFLRTLSMSIFSSHMVKALFNVV